MDTKRFKKVDESYRCEHCGFQVPHSVEGSCRNHCSKCLYSKHLDINPGDRLATCFGLMMPIDLDMKSGKTRVLHKCVKCGFERWNKAAVDDDVVRYYEEKSQQVQA